MKASTVIVLAVLVVSFSGSARSATTQRRYYAHEAVEDAHGVIAPWYRGANGQCDFRVRIAAESMKRYPWTDTARAVAAAPEYVFSGHWNIASDGTITVPAIQDWNNGDLGQRAAYVLGGLVDYYRYTGDAAAIAHITTQADALLDYCQTPADHPWPGFLISVPTRGKPYGRADPHGFIQLDIVAEVGLALIRASQVAGNARWFEAAKHWGDLLAENCNRTPGMPPWPRYANPEDVPWPDLARGGVVFILDFFDALIRAGHTGKEGILVKARDAGVAYLRDVLLPNWTGVDTWGRNYWDWVNNVQVENITEYVARYLMDHPAEFPNWRNDARNIMTLFLNRTSVNPLSNGDVYSGAWAYPESSGCCDRSLWYGPLELANVYAQYGILAGSEWAREIARRKIILATYDFHETGLVEDNIDGGQRVAHIWFKIAHPMALKHVLAAMAWMPEIFGARRENHIMRTSGTVTSVVYGDGRIAYSTYDAPANTVDVLRLAFRPRTVRADGKALAIQRDGSRNGYQCRDLPGGDCIVTIRHDGATHILIEGADPQEVVEEAGMTFAGEWAETKGGRAASQAGAGMSCVFSGDQVRLIGSVGPSGGLADVYLDGVKQLVGIDCWNLAERGGQVLYYRNGLASGSHTLKVTVSGKKNPLSKGADVYIDALQHSDAGTGSGPAGFGEGGGPVDAQRMIFGYTGRTDYVDAAGNAWRPGTEFIIRAGRRADSVTAAWWTERTRLQIAGTRDPELYRYGIHGPEFWVDFTVGPGMYHARIKFAETRNIDPKLRALSLSINGREVAADMDIAATACGPGQYLRIPRPDERRLVWTGLNRAVDVVFDNLQPKNGVISIRFKGSPGGEAIVQAIEVGPGPGGSGAAPVRADGTDAAAAPAAP